MAQAASGRWSAQGDGWVLEWTPQAPHLGGSEGVRDAVSRWIGAAADRGVAVTPTGPFVRASAGEPLAVLSALVELRRGGLGDFTLTGNAPRVPPIPPGAVG